ncbi:MAG: LuxR C-terminal-related transcriptional regulator [Myxococcota bacterium]|nr:LuxR C-terminal-related transcriptional regulator [Myxococcota bacterium]
MTERIRSATSFHAIAHSVVVELASMAGVGGCAVVLCDSGGEPTLWIGDGFVDRAGAHAYLEGGFRADASFARVCASQIAHCDGDLWVAPLLGGDGVIGMLRVVVSGAVDRNALTTIAAYVSIRIAILGLAFDDARSIDSLTPRQREVAELVAHGCTNIEIARMLKISPNAVKKHVSRVLAVLDVSNRTELAALTGRWRAPSGIDQVLPPTLQVVLRNSAKTQAVQCPEKVA